MSALIMAISSIFITTAHHHNMGFFSPPEASGRFPLFPVGQSTLEC